MKDLVATIQALHASNIRCGMQSFRDVDVWMGNTRVGCVTRKAFPIANLGDAAQWLHEQAHARYPNSDYAKANALGRSRFCLECCKQWFGDGEPDCPERLCAFKLPREDGMNGLILAITLQVVYQRRLLDEPHLSRQRVREDFEEHGRRRQATAPRPNTYAVEGSAVRHGGHATPRTTPQLMPVAAGWNDYVARTPYQEAYAKASKPMQENYEMGRACAAVAASVQDVGPWPLDMSWADLLTSGRVTEKAAELILAEQRSFLLKSSGQN